MIYSFKNIEKLYPQDIIDIKDKYLSGLSIKKISLQYKISVTPVRKILKQFNIEIRKDMRKYNIDDNFFDIIDTEEKAYFLGLLYADGCNLPKRNTIVISLIESDKYLLLALNNAVKSNKPLGFVKLNHKNKNWHDNYRLEISSKHMCKKLEELGCMPQKTFKLKFPTNKQVPTDLINHFIRGYFDGDGCISMNLFKNKYYKTNIVSTDQFCNTISTMLQAMNIKHRIRPINDKNTCKLHIDGLERNIKFLSWIYKDSTIHMKRKYDKFIQLLEFYDKKIHINHFS